MKHWQTIRLRAAELHARVFEPAETPGVLLNGEEVMRRLDALTFIEREPVAPGHPALQNCFALINPAYFSLFYRSDLPVWFQMFCQAHEYAHYFLHQGESHCSESDVNLQPNAGDLPTGENRVAGYSARERREREANLFARELLLPSRLLKKLFNEDKWRAKNFTEVSGLPFDFVCQQLAHALLISDYIEGTDGQVSDNPRNAGLELDSSQQRAARSTAKRLLIEAGPGTGKTRTLVARVLHLLETNVQPANILVLTFSNKAAEEMRERIAAANPTAAAGLWLGTFHAFGLEILRKFAVEAGLELNFKLLDPIDAGLLLEQHLLELELEHYQNLHQPNAHLKSILSAISRAKDELASAADYKQAAEQMLAEAEGDAAKLLAAHKAREVARVYRVYEALLAGKGRLDLGDLIFRAVELLRQNDLVKQNLQTRFRHILVDELQDVNRASGRLLGELAGEDNSLWVVGDARQTIYRWRGASAANLRLFKSDFPSAETLSLTTNYRSQPPITRLLNEFAGQVETESHFQGWNAHRSEQNARAVKLTIADDLADEARSVAAQIRHRQLAGVSFQNQVVLARTNNILTKFAVELTRNEIPVLYLGNLFERAEIRDLLSLLALTGENQERHLLRLCGMPEYALSLEDAKRLVSAAGGIGVSAALKLAQTDRRFSVSVREKLARLDEQLADLTAETTAWQFFAAYLFDRSDYLNEILGDDSTAGRAARFAIYQLLQFALSEADKPARFANLNPRESFLRFVRHLAASREESVFRRLPAWAENVDAVKLLTVHQAKGLEFPVVYLPHLSNRYYPNPRRGESCPLPASLTAMQIDAKTEHEQEEKCLFFVAISRAQDDLLLSCANRYGEASTKPSRFLELLAATLPPPKRFENQTASESDEQDQSVAISRNQLYSFHELEVYLRCPQQYFYEQILRVGGDHDAATYLQFHQCVYKTIDWAKQRKLAGQIVDRAAAENKLSELWRAHPICDHAYAAIYFHAARGLVAQAVELLTELEDCHLAVPQLEFALGNGRVSLKADLLEQHAGAKIVTAHKIKTGRAPANLEWSDRDKLQFSVLQAALWANFPNHETAVSIHYLSNDASLIFDTTTKKVGTQTLKLETAIRGIEAGNFRPQPDAHKCPACAHYFLCPSNKK